jgi:hypothetical protein
MKQPVGEGILLGRTRQQSYGKKKEEKKYDSIHE